MEPLRHASCLIAAGAVIATTGPVAAYPAPGSTSPALTSLRQVSAANPELTDSEIFLDSNPASARIYVGPSSREVAAQSLAPTTLPLDCSGLAAAYGSTYKVPAIDFRTASRQPFSPFFDVSFGNYVRHETTIAAILKIGDDINAIRTAHATEYAAVSAARDNETFAQGDVDRITLQISKLDGAVNLIVSLMSGATDPDILAELQSELDDAKATRDAAMPALTASLTTARSKRDAATSVRVAAEANFAPVQQSIDSLDAQRTGKRKSVEATEALTKSAFDTALATLKRYEEAVAAFATVHVPPWRQEVESLQFLANTNVPANQRVTVTRLPIFNVTLFPLSTDVSDGTNAGGSNPLGIPYRSDGRVVEPSNVVAVPTDAVDLPSLFRRTSGAVLPFAWGGAPSSPSGTGDLTVPLNRRTLCGGRSAISPVALSGQLVVNGTSSVLRWMGQSFAPVAQGNAAQDLGLRYRYLVAADPMPVVCTANFATFQGRLVARDETAWLDGVPWTDARFQEVEAAGIHCDPTPGSDLGVLPDADRRRILQRAEEELVAELVDLFGTSWQTTTRTGTSADADPSSPGVVAACNGAAHCSLWSVNFRPLESVLPGARAMAVGEPLVRDFLSTPWRIVRSQVKIAVDTFL